MSVCETPFIFGQIYVIIDPTIASSGGYVRYPGKHQLEKQKEMDLQESLEKYLDGDIRGVMREKESKRPLNVWLKEMYERGIRPTIKCIEVCYSFSELNTRETYWIAYYRARYSDLLNRAPGGVGGWDKGTAPPNKGKKGLYKASEETKQIMREKMSGTGNPMSGHSCTEFMTEEEITLWKKHQSESGKRKPPDTEEAKQHKKEAWDNPERHKRHSENMSERQFGENNPGARITNAQAVEIRTKYALCTSKKVRAIIQELATEYNVTKRFIRGIINFLHYKSAGGPISEPIKLRRSSVELATTSP